MLLCFSELVFISVFWSYCQLFHWNICCNLAESKSLWLSRINYVRPACSLIHSSHCGNSVQTQQIRLRIYCIYKPVQHHRLNTENNGVMTTAWKHTNILLQTKQKIYPTRQQTEIFFALPVVTDDLSPAFTKSHWSFCSW